MKKELEKKLGVKEGEKDKEKIKEKKKEKLGKMLDVEGRGEKDRISNKRRIDDDRESSLSPAKKPYHEG